MWILLPVTLGLIVASRAIYKKSKKDGVIEAISWSVLLISYYMFLRSGGKLLMTFITKGRQINSPLATLLAYLGEFTAATVAIALVLEES